jgi:hypothetical protein
MDGRMSIVVCWSRWLRETAKMWDPLSAKIDDAYPIQMRASNRDFCFLVLYLTRETVTQPIRERYVVGLSTSDDELLLRDLLEVAYTMTGRDTCLAIPPSTLASSECRW